MEGAITTNWIHGCSIMTISTTKLGWSEIVVRRPTGTVSWLCRLQNKINDSNYSSLSLSLSIFCCFSFFVSTSTLEIDPVTLPSILMMHRKDKSKESRPEGEQADTHDMKSTKSGEFGGGALSPSSLKQGKSRSPQYFGKHRVPAGNPKDSSASSVAESLTVGGDQDSVHSEPFPSSPSDFEEQPLGGVTPDTQMDDSEETGEQSEGKFRTRART